jgi:5S rRNA maturation endonuclease (ribonuclease M5)
MHDLVRRFEYLSKKDVSAQLLFVQNNDHMDFKKRIDAMDKKAGWYNIPSTDKPSGPSAAWTGGKDYDDPTVLAQLAKPLPDSHEEHVMKMISCLDDEATVYLHGPDRRFTDATIKKWKMGWHPGARRISVPQYDHIGRLVNVGGRFLPYWPEWVPIGSKAPKWMHTLGFNRELYVFGEDWFELSDDGRGTVFVTEGAFDVAYLDQCDVPNVCGINGSHINKQQVNKLVRWFDHVVLVMDGDEAGIEAADALEKRFSSRVAVSRFLVPDGRDPNAMTDDEVLSLKSRFVA